MDISSYDSYDDYDVSSSSASSDASAAPLLIPAALVPCNFAELYSQRLNNSASLCIEIGHYDKAISSLQRALQLSNHTSHREDKEEDGEDEEERHFCMCYGCTLDGCISHSENNPPTINNIKIVSYNPATNINGNSNGSNCITKSSSSSNSSNKKRKIVIQEQTIPSNRDLIVVANDNDAFNSENRKKRKTNDDTDDTTNKKINDIKINGNDDDRTNTRSNSNSNGSKGVGYIYRRPIRIPREGHAMGSTLFLIIIFNLALAHQSKAMERISNNEEATTTVTTKSIIRKTIMFYNLTLKWQSRLIKSSSNNISFTTNTNTNANTRIGDNVMSIRFNMMIYNNLSEMYRMSNTINDNKLKSKQCLERLLSLVMIIVEFKTRNDMVNINNDTLQSLQQGQSQQDSPMYYNVNTDGFLQNLCSNGCSLIVQQPRDRCANAA